MSERFDNPEQALIWAVESTKLRSCSYYGKPNYVPKKNRAYQIDDVFLCFQKALRDGLITRAHFDLLKQVIKTGQIPRNQIAQERWDELIDAVRPLMVRKGILHDDRKESAYGQK